MTGPGFVTEEPYPLSDGLAEMLASPRHLRRYEIQVVDYSGEPEPALLEPLLDPKPEPPPSRWRRLFRRLA